MFAAFYPQLRGEETFFDPLVPTSSSREPHDTKLLELRRLIVGRITTTIHPYLSAGEVNSNGVRHLVTRAKKVEEYIYGKAEDLDDYYLRVAEWIYNMRREKAAYVASRQQRGDSVRPRDDSDGELVSDGEEAFLVPAVSEQERTLGIKECLKDLLKFDEKVYGEPDSRLSEV